MKKEKVKENIRKVFYKLKNKIWMILMAAMVMQTKVFASGSISTAEVTQATENIKNAIIKLAMPIRWNFTICKYCYYSFKDDSQF